MKRITIIIELDIPDPEEYKLPEWIEGKTNKEIEKWGDDKTDDFIRDVLECDFNTHNAEGFTQVEDMD